jgi:O-antigen ligase
MDAIDLLRYLDKVTDWSAAVRFLKWFAATDGFRLNPVLGYGTGVTHVMDGNYIKLLAETGIAGTALWLGFYGYFMKAVGKFRRRTKLGKALLFIMVSILLNSVLIDMFEASKPMEMLWLMVGGVLAYGAAAGPAHCDEPAPEQEGTGESFPAAGQERIHPEGITE